ncbi:MULTISPECIES: hypothetical protein [Streptomyces]|uniref:hypothetical protein n=1 Tax=Streptomyces TaxID=1883 RepID=UPI00345C12D8
MNTTEKTHGQDEPEQATESPTAAPADSPVADSEDSAPDDYRQALEEAHSRLEAAQERIDAMLLREIEHQVATRIEVPSDLFDLGKHKLADLLTADGDVDAGKVAAAIDALLKSRPNLAAHRASWGDVGGGYRGGMGDDTPDWTTALRSPRR